jgi:hypothetical protein
VELIFVYPKRKNIKKRADLKGVREFLNYLLVTFLGGLGSLSLLFSGMGAIYCGVVPGFWF